MAIIRHEEQEFLLISDLINSTTSPSLNDTIYIKETNRSYRWEEGIFLPSDNIFVIEQLSESANGRWVSENESFVFNAYVETDYLPSQFDISDKTISIPNLPKARVSDVILRNSDDLDKPHGFIGYSQGNDKISIKFENLSERPMYPQTLHISVNMTYDRNWDENTGDLTKVFLISSNNSSGLIYSTDDLATFKTLNIPEFTSLTQIGEIAHDVERREIYVLGGAGFSLATNNVVMGKLVGVRLDVSGNLVYDSALQIVHGDNIRAAADIKSFDEYLYVNEQIPVSRTNAQIHRIRKSDLSIVNSADINNQSNLDLVVNDYGVYLATGRSVGVGVNFVRFDLDLSNKTTTQLSSNNSIGVLATTIGNTIYIVTSNNPNDTLLYVYEFDTETNSILRSLAETIPGSLIDYGSVDFFSLETDGERLYISTYDTATYPNNTRMVIVNIADFTVVSQNVNTALLGDDSVYDNRNERVVFTAYDGASKGSVFTYDKGTGLETIIPINSETLSALDLLYIPKID